MLMMCVVDEHYTYRVAAGFGINIDKKVFKTFWILFCRYLFQIWRLADCDVIQTVCPSDFLNIVKRKKILSKQFSIIFFFFWRYLKNSDCDVIKWWWKVLMTNVIRIAQPPDFLDTLKRKNIENNIFSFEGI